MFCFCDAFCVELIPITAVYCSDQGELSLASFFALSIINRISDRMGDIESIRVIYSIVSELTSSIIMTLIAPKFFPIKSADLSV